MARFNPYGNSQIADSISGIAKALIGSADTDAALARARASDASARASDASAKSYLAQARERAANADILESLAKAGATTSGNQAVQNLLAGAMGLNVVDENFMGPTRPTTMRLGTDDASALLRTALGTYGTADQVTEALGNMGVMRDEGIARSMILGGTPDQAQRGALTLYPAGGEFQNPSFAANKLAAELRNKLDERELINTMELNKQGSINKTDLEKQGLINQNALDKQKLLNQNALEIQNLIEAGEIEQTELKIDSEEQIAADRLKAQSGWEAEKLATEKDIAGIVDKRERDIAKAELKQAQSEQVDKQYIVSDGIITMSEELATRLGVTTKTEVGDGNEVFAIDVRQGEGKIPVLLGEGDDAQTIYLDGSDLEKYNIQNKGGKLILPKGAIFNAEKASKTQKDPAYSNLKPEEAETVKAEANARIKAVFGEDLPTQVQLGLIDYVINEVNEASATKEFGQATTDILGPLTSKGFMLLGGYGGTNIPVHFHEMWMSFKPQMKLEKFKKAVTKMASEVGYTAPEIAQIFQDSRYN